MLTNKPMWMRFAVPIGVFALVLLVEDGLINLFPTIAELYYALLLTALGGAFIMSAFLPHPRQERKRREAREALELQQERQWPIHTPETEEGETLAEKRP